MRYSSLSNSAENTIRSFIAIELDERVRAHIAAAIESLRGERIDGLRLVRAEGVHLTLKFLGDIDAENVPQIAEAMARVAARHAVFELTLGAPGVFPNTGRARVLWLGVEGDLRQLRMLQAGIEEALTEIGFAAERQRFNPHLTIGRMQHRASQEDRRRATDALASLRMPTDCRIAANAISLMKSALLPGGAVYERIAYSELTRGWA